MGREYALAGSESWLFTGLHENAPGAETEARQ